jgi:hypothetical protein
VPTTSSPTRRCRHSSSLAAADDRPFDGKFVAPDLSQSGMAKAPKKRRPGLFSPEGVARARGFWLILLVLLSSLAWAGIAWILLRALS